MYYGNEVRDFNLVPKAQSVTVSEKEQELGIGLSFGSRSEGFVRELQRRILHSNIGDAG